MRIFSFLGSCSCTIKYVDWQRSNTDEICDDASQGVKEDAPKLGGSRAR